MLTLQDIAEAGLMDHTPKTLYDAKSVQVVARFVLRSVVLCAFAAFAGNNFGRSLAALLLLSTALCVVAAVIRREKPLDRSLTHWDEAAVYGFLYGVVAIMLRTADPV